MHSAQCPRSAVLVYGGTGEWRPRARVRLHHLTCGLQLSRHAAADTAGKYLYTEGKYLNV